MGTVSKRFDYLKYDGWSFLTLFELLHVPVQSQLALKILVLL